MQQASAHNKAAPCAILNDFDMNDFARVPGAHLLFQTCSSSSQGGAFFWPQHQRPIDAYIQSEMKNQNLTM
eukprot:scaffold455036_cov17-Prasinocladus_malaysianus.AAC.1